MTSLVLSREGVFPIISNILNSTGFRYSGTIQGEGRLAGTPSIFVRLQGCNLRCIWRDADGNIVPCDTRHASFDNEGQKVMEVADIVKIIEQNRGNINHVVITGGEPMLQARGLVELLDRLKVMNIHTTIETNGTIFNEQCVKLASLMSISPKLPSSIPSEDKLSVRGYIADFQTIKHAKIIADIRPLQQIIDAVRKYKNALQLKFVVASLQDADDIKSYFIDRLRDISTDDIFVMPMATTAEAMHRNGLFAMKMAIENNWHYSPRLHIDMFGNREGV